MSRLIAEGENKMGRVISNAVRSMVFNYNNRQVRGNEICTVLEGVTFMFVTPGRPEGSGVDGSVYATATFSVRPGQIVRVVGYGDEFVATFNNMNKGDLVSMFAKKMFNSDPMRPQNMYRLEEITGYTPVNTPDATHTNVAADEVGVQTENSL